MNRFIGLFLTLFFLMPIAVNIAFAETIFTHLAKYTENDTRQDYHINLLRLALDKTAEEYGPYKLVPASPMNAARSMASVRANSYINYFANETVTRKKLNEFGYVPFPILRGIVGYRVFLTSPKTSNLLKEVHTIEDLRKFSIGQGLGWEDIDILEHNGFKVVVGNNYEGLFRMVESNRFDLFARSIGEVIYEYEIFKETIKLNLDKSIAIYYPNPRYFFTHKSNKIAIERVTRGLRSAYEDGSFMDLWNKYHLESIKRIDLPNRKIFKLENPFIKGIDRSYEKYIYQP